MVRMHVGVDHVADRLVGHGADGVAQALPHDGAAQRVDHRDRLAADDEAGIRHVALILRRLHLDTSLMHEDARRDLAEFDRVRRRRCGMSRNGAQKRHGGESKARAQESPGGSAGGRGRCTLSGFASKKGHGQEGSHTACPQIGSVEQDRRFRCGRPASVDRVKNRTILRLTSLDSTGRLNFGDMRLK